MLQTGKSSVCHLGFKIFEELQHFVEEIKLLHYPLFPESTVISETRNILLFPNYLAVILFFLVSVLIHLFLAAEIKKSFVNSTR